MALSTSATMSQVEPSPDKAFFSQEFEDDDFDPGLESALDKLEPSKPVKRQRLAPPSWGVTAKDTTHVSDTHMENQASSLDPDGAQDLSFDEAESAVLSEEQAHVEQLVKQGQNVFFTGNAGTGKSFLLKRLISFLKAKHGATVFVTAATGIAATHIGGTTLHSALGIGVPQKAKDFGKMHKKDTAKRLWQCKVLIIDEVSMISAELFHLLEGHMRQLRHNDQPFGGVQLVLAGDYFQLPPIEKRWQARMDKDEFLNRGFTFQCPAWHECKMHQVLLTKVFRQRDRQFVDLLDAIRSGEQRGEEAVKALAGLCQRPLPEVNGVAATELFARNKQVDDVNTSRLATLPGPKEPVYFVSKDEVIPEYGKEGDFQVKRNLEHQDFWKSCLAPDKLELKVGAQVMLLKNLDLDGGGGQMLVNGSRGVVTEFVDKPPVEKEAGQKVKEAKDKVRSADPQDKGAAARDLGKAEASLLNLKQYPSQRLPKVKFINGRELLVCPEKFSADYSQLGVCTRVQVPLKLAWALTIHKCQGMTVDLARVSLANMFAEGQAYVALSRARTLEGLQITGYSPGCVKTNPTVRHFYQTLSEGRPFDDLSAWDAFQRSHASMAETSTASTPGPTQQAFDPTQPGFNLTPQQGFNPTPKQWFEPGSDVKADAAPAMGEPRNSQKSEQSQPSQQLGQCFRCQKLGHWARDCPDLGQPPDQRRALGNASTPGIRPMASQEDAPRRGSGQGGPPPGRGNIPHFFKPSGSKAAQPSARGGGRFGGGAGRGRGQDKCYKCGGFGHWASNCPQSGQ